LVKKRRYCDMTSKEQLIEIFQDTLEWCNSNSTLSDSVKHSIAGTRVYKMEEDPILSEKGEDEAVISVTREKTFEAAMKLREDYPCDRIAVHNFASATNPGGGVKKGSRAQEECLCRTSTLYPVLNTRKLWNEFYGFHRERHDVKYTDTCIYTPDIKVIKTDNDLPKRLDEKNWINVDVLTCAAPNLRRHPGNAMNPNAGNAIRIKDRELLELHVKRAKHLMCVAAANKVDILVLGAFGCGAFQNKPEIVAMAYKEALRYYRYNFKAIRFAVYCSKYDARNYDTFQKILSGK
jgi:uncharacterized protein (TIGR02452 family)